MAESTESAVSVPSRTDVESTEAARYDDVRALDLQRRLRVPQVALYADVTSTMDVAHRLAADGAAPGTVVLADHQTAGRGRGGRHWRSAAGAGIWLTLIERPDDRPAIEVLALRLGLRIAPILDRYVGRQVGLKWPNDLYVDGRKLGGILVEARWQDGAPMWVAIGLGVNVHLPAPGPGPLADAMGLPPGTRRLDVLADLVPQLRAAASALGSLTSRELAEFAARDIARGRECQAPSRGRVEGIGPTGEILISHEGVGRGYRSGSLVLIDEREGR